VFHRDCQFLQLYEPIFHAMLKKINTYFWYFYEYMKHGDLRSVSDSIGYLLFKKTNANDRIVQSSLGKFFCRKGTNDFQFANYHYEWGVKKYILDRIDNYSVFIDAGSCIGIYAMLAAKLKLQTIAIEPIASNYEALIKNLQLNNLEDQVKAFKIGLGNKNEEVYFNFDRVNTGASQLGTAHHQDSCQVSLKTFDSLLPELELDTKSNILFKLDVEGMEIEALQGAANFIRQYPNITLVLEEKITGKEKIRKLLDEFGTFEFGKIDQYNMYAKKINN